MKYCDDFTVTQNRTLNERMFSLRLKKQGMLPQIKPGQFVELRVNEPTGVLLRRPISVHDVDYCKNEIVLLVQTAGKGTKQLSEVKCGEKLNLVYPLGNGFATQGSKVLLVGGGVGIAPLLYLAKAFADKGILPDILLGFRTKKQMIPLEEFERYGKLHVSTEDGSCGEMGLVTQNKVFAEQFDKVYCCGPTPMMRSVAKNCEQRGIGCFVSLENKMACGIGACLCCVQNTKEGHKCTCTEGPVFQSEDIIW